MCFAEISVTNMAVFYDILIALISTALAVLVCMITLDYLYFYCFLSQFLPVVINALVSVLY